MSTGCDTERLAETIIGRYTEQVELYRGLLSLATEQGARLRRGEPLSAYAALCPLKDDMLLAIGRLERELAPLKRRWWAEEVRPEARQRLNAVLDGLLLTIEAIRAQEERNDRLLLGRGLPAEPVLRQGAFIPGAAAPDAARGAAGQAG